MEHAQRVTSFAQEFGKPKLAVLILILMEHAQRVIHKEVDEISHKAS